MSRQHAKFEIARVYGAPVADGRFRILVDRLWPRGIRKKDLHLDAWMKDLAPSTELRRWFNHESHRWDEFRTRYQVELNAKSPELAELRGIANEQKVLLLYAARDEQFNHAVVLKEVLENIGD